MCAMCITIQAQNLVSFKLQPNGTFITEDGKDFVIVEFSDKTASELYDMVKQNVIETYKNPKHVMTENEPTSIKIRALSEPIFSGLKLIGGVTIYRAYYNLVFHFKDGRIKVDAPIIESNLDVDGPNPISQRFDKYVDDWFDKDGQPKKKKADKIAAVEFILLSPVNILIGNYKSKKQKEEEEKW